MSDWAEMARAVKARYRFSSEELGRRTGTDGRQVRRWIAGAFQPSKAAQLLLTQLYESSAITEKGEQRIVEDQQQLLRKADELIAAGHDTEANAIIRDLMLPNAQKLLTYYKARGATSTPPTG